MYWGGALPPSVLPHYTHPTHYAESALKYSRPARQIKHARANPLWLKDSIRSGFSAKLLYTSRVIHKLMVRWK